MKRDTIKNAGKLWRASVSSHGVFNKCIKTEFRQRDVSHLRHWTVFFGLREAGTSLNRTVNKLSLVPHYVIFLIWCKRVSRDCLVCKITDMYCVVTRNVVALHVAHLTFSSLLIRDWLSGHPISAKARSSPLACRQCQLDNGCNLTSVHLTSSWCTSYLSY